MDLAISVISLEVFKKANDDTGYNDWYLIEVLPSRKSFIEEDVLAHLEIKMREVGRIISSQVQDGMFGA